MAKAQDVTIAQNADVTAALKNYYANVYGTPKDDEDALKTIREIFKEKMGYSFLKMDDQEALGEYYRMVLGRGLPAYEWVLEAIHVAGKKDPEKKNIRYVIGIIRDWLKNGFGHMPTDEETHIFEYFGEHTTHQPSDQAAAIIRRLMGTYGSVRVTRMIGQLTTVEADMSKLLAMDLEERLSNKYDEAAATALSNKTF